jgi:hypothetical protein
MSKKKARRFKTKEEEEFVALDEMFLTLSRRLDKIPAGDGKSAAIKWGILAGILITASSVLFYLNSQGILPWVGTWIPALVGAPAGVIFYMIGLGLVTRTDIGQWSVFQMREEYSFKQRLRRVGVWFAVYALVFIPLGRFIPYGLGGAVFITLVMSALTVARRTTQELAWAKQGIPDPRDLAEIDEKDDYAEESVEQPETSAEADKIYYDKQRGGFGGKLK